MKDDRDEYMVVFTLAGIAAAIVIGMSWIQESGFIK